MADESQERAGDQADIGPLVRKVGHLVRNKLAVIVNSAYYLRLRLGDADGKLLRHLDLMEQEVTTASEVIADLMDFALVKEPARRPLDINRLITDVLSELQLPETINLVTELRPGLPLIAADATQLARALEKLLLNAVEAMSSTEEGGCLTVRSGLGDDRQTLWITIADTGRGLSAEEQSHLFEPLFTTKPQGFGLGLPIARGLIERHGGQLKVRSVPGEGTTCTIILSLGGDAAP